MIASFEKDKSSVIILNMHRKNGYLNVLVVFITEFKLNYM